MKYSVEPLYVPDDIPTPRNLPAPALGGTAIDGVTAKVK